MRDSYTNRNHCRHTKCGRMRGMVVGEGGRSSGVQLYIHLIEFNSFSPQQTIIIARI